MAPSISPASPDPHGLLPLERFYAFHARIYDFTRPFLLFGRGRLLERLEVGPGQLVLDVGCGTGHSFARLADAGAEVVGIEPSRPMRVRAQARIARLGLGRQVRLDPRPYGSHTEHEGRAARVLFSYSLTMMPAWERLLERAALDLAPGGRIGVVDFLDARGPLRAGLLRSHVELGPERLAGLSRRFPAHRLEFRWSGLWRHFLFVGQGQG
jgi:S-adenosylmethionine-diacylgycerolhomoserine-N-methlytransferase